MIKRRKYEQVFCEGEDGGPPEERLGQAAVEGTHVMDVAAAAGFLSSSTAPYPPKGRKLNGQVVRDGRSGDEEYGAKRHGVIEDDRYGKLLGKAAAV
jgi:hypothetical protein